MADVLLRRRLHRRACFGRWPSSGHGTWWSGAPGTWHGSSGSVFFILHFVEVAAAASPRRFAPGRGRSMELGCLRRTLCFLSRLERLLGLALEVLDARVLRVAARAWRASRRRSWWRSPRAARAGCRASPAPTPRASRSGTWPSASPRIALKIALKKRPMRVNMEASPERGENRRQGRCVAASRAPSGRGDLGLRPALSASAMNFWGSRSSSSAAGRARGPSSPGGPRPCCACGASPSPKTWRSDLFLDHGARSARGSRPGPPRCT